MGYHQFIKLTFVFLFCLVFPKISCDESEVGRLKVMMFHLGQQVRQLETKAKEKDNVLLQLQKQISEKDTVVTELQEKVKEKDKV